MSFSVRREREFELALTYQGPVAVLEFEFSFFFPRGADDVAFLLDLALFSIEVLPIIQANYLHYTIESDEDPLPDRYRVKVMLAGETEVSEGVIDLSQPFALARPQVFLAPVTLIAIAVAIGIALVFAAIAWRTYNLGVGPAIFGSGSAAVFPGLLTVGAIGLGLYLIFGRRKANA